MKKIAILGDGRKKNVVETVKKQTEWIGSRCEVAAVDLSPDSDLSGLKADLAIVFGGDGTMLRVARRMGTNQIPVVGINFGKLGFLAEVNNKQIRETLSDILDAPLCVSERMMLRAGMSGTASRSFSSLAVNDVVVTSKGIRMVQTELYIGENLISRFIGDGLVIATPTGSTAYSLAAGGPLVEPSIDTIIVTPLSAHSLTARPMAVAADRTVHVRLTAGYDEAVLIVDGQKEVEMSKDDRLTVERADCRFRLVELKDLGYFDILKAKLNWGSNANYGV